MFMLGKFVLLYIKDIFIYGKKRVFKFNFGVVYSDVEVVYEEVIEELYNCVQCE